MFNKSIQIEKNVYVSVIKNAYHICKNDLLREWEASFPMYPLGIAKPLVVLFLHIHLHQQLSKYAHSRP